MEAAATLQGPLLEVKRQDCNKVSLLLDWPGFKQSPLLLLLSIV